MLVYFILWLAVVVGVAAMIQFFVCRRRQIQYPIENEHKWRGVNYVYNWLYAGKRK